MLATAGLCAQTTAVITSDRDSTLYQSPTGALAGGACTGVFVGVTDQNSNPLRRALLHFDVAGAIPAGAEILAAELSIQVTQHNSNVTVRAHRVLQDWGEGSSLPPGNGGSGTAAATGDATWVNRFHPGNPWNSPGGDFAATSSLTFAVPSPGPATASSTLGAVLDVQDWLDNPGQNFGWLLKTDELQVQSAFRCNSREASNNPPTLRVTYVTQGQAGTWGQGCTVSGQEYRHAWNGNPIGGTNVQLAQTNGPANALAANLMALNYDRIGSPLSTCNLYLPFGGVLITHSIVTLDGGGNGSAQVAVPTGWPGLMLTTQAAALANTTAGFVLSNAAIAILQ
ncbi:MAG: DNRLRE domain-containing protein [Planctomycetes bacterium]|nr:DNRLRE domain-containing protein [Planctomycetota bacterium]